MAYKEVRRNNDKIRPVNCAICQRWMYYWGDERHEDEVFVSVTNSSTDRKSSYYVHVKCWEEFIKGRLVENKFTSGN